MHKSDFRYPLYFYALAKCSNSTSCMNRFSILLIDIPNNFFSSMYCSSCVSRKLSKSRRTLLRPFYCYFNGQDLRETFNCTREALSQLPFSICLSLCDWNQVLFWLTASLSFSSRFLALFIWFSVALIALSSFSSASISVISFSSLPILSLYLVMTSVNYNQ